MSATIIDHRATAETLELPALDSHNCIAVETTRIEMGDLRVQRLRCPKCFYPILVETAL